MQLVSNAKQAVSFTLENLSLIPRSIGLEEHLGAREVGKTIHEPVSIHLPIDPSFAALHSQVFLYELDNQSRHTHKSRRHCKSLQPGQYLLHWNTSREIIETPSWRYKRTHIFHTRATRNISILISRDPLMRIQKTNVANARDDCVKRRITW